MFNYQSSYWNYFYQPKASIELFHLYNNNPLADFLQFPKLKKKKKKNLFSIARL